MYYSLTRATSWNVVGYLYLIIASLIATPILVHSLGLSQFAQYSLIIATLGLVSTFNLGLPQAVTRALSRDHEFSLRRQTLWVTSSLLFILTGIIAGIVATIACYLLGVGQSALPSIFLIALMSNVLSHYTTLPQAEGHFGYFNAKTFIVGTGNTLLAAYLSWIGQSLTIILSVQLACYLLTLFALAYFSLKFFPRPWSYKPSLVVAQPLIAFGLKNQAGTLVGQVQAQYAKYLLVALSPLSLSGYVIAQGLVQKAAGAVTQVSSALYPASARVGTHNIRPLYYRLQFGLFFLALLGIGIYELVGYSFLSWWLHSSELVSIVDSVLKVMVWYFAVLVLCPLASTMLDSRGRPELTSLFTLVTTVIEISLAFILFPRFGLFAPIYSALIALVLTTPALLYVTDRIIRVK